MLIYLWGFHSLPCIQSSLSFHITELFLALAGFKSITFVLSTGIIDQASNICECIVHRIYTLTYLIMKHTSTDKLIIPNVLNVLGVLNCIVVLLY